MNTRCKPGELAIIIRADYPCNLGKIVRIVQQHDGSGEINFFNRGVVWWVTCPSRMKWSIGSKTFRRHAGPAPDDQLLPIRGQQDEKAAQHEAQKLLQRLQNATSKKPAEIKQLSTSPAEGENHAQP